uniref:Caffeoyl-CoA O-methyltransferase n=1 Tax=Alexandrium andersonii TaxID=327968 RepID=A0A7S2MNR9_9DINO|mmetsp:Transcript_72842/g.163104  ORF Transcript_72842/g.163104 Transcript_72842/m.163104 type:complete len:302 (-) Transcript_72842:58-963(-)
MAGTAGADGKVSGLASGAFPTATFPCDHLSAVGTTGGAKAPAKDATSFPNDHIKGPSTVGQASGAKAPVEAASWARPEQRATASSLRQAVNEVDWSVLFAEGKTSCQAQPAWSASDERCNALGCFCAMLKARRVLEIGAFCGAASLTMAEVLPADGEVVSLDIDPYPFQEVGKEFKAASPHYSKVRFMPGAAMQSLDTLVAEKEQRPFDLAIIDADKAGMRSYFDLIVNTPGFLSDHATICVDITPFKGQPPDRYVKFGQADRWVQNSGQEEIDGFRTFFQGSSNFQVFELAGMLVVRRST